ncbi:efflux RND transporter periplasmic adaptor subunit [Roseiconus nitratireducens]|uniref:Efflux RND transporter periplasmic adaptor subunit n=1 Tax=Roseiconus nitratireducens TaxID=2605748 RepID=A0A5M6DEC8_9BACT|nr:efflux RND transporter periplasmic adaptor subunit [Roseiconus nitratireducens]KAA5545911.1 efflux RND transporter periplasmic adaptor subunit [Roseiconus nitratireducens]
MFRNQRNTTTQKFSERAIAQKRERLPWARIVAGISCGCVVLGMALKPSGTSLAQVPPSIRQSAIEGEHQRPVSIAVDYDGFTEPKFDVLVAATEIGRLDDLYVAIGDRVQRGQVIAKMEDALQQDAVKTARWRASMHGELDAAKSETELMKIRLDQLQSLADKQMARPDELKRARADWEIAKAKELSAMEQNQLRKLELERYELQLKRRRIESPMDGTVSEIFHAPGEYVTPSDPAVVRLLVLDQIYAVFNVPVENVDDMQPGRSAVVFLISLGANLEGVIDSVSPAIDGESGTVRVKVLLENPDGDLRSGDRCRLRMVRSESKNQSAKRTRSLPVRRMGNLDAGPVEDAYQR